MYKRITNFNECTIHTYSNSCCVLLLMYMLVYYHWFVFAFTWTLLFRFILLSVLSTVFNCYQFTSPKNDKIKMTSLWYSTRIMPTICSPPIIYDNKWILGYSCIRYLISYEWLGNHNRMDVTWAKSWVNASHFTNQSTDFVFFNSLTRLKYKTATAQALHFMGIMGKCVHVKMSSCCNVK